MTVLDVLNILIKNDAAFDNPIDVYVPYSMDFDKSYKIQQLKYDRDSGNAYFEGIETYENSSTYQDDYVADSEEIIRNIFDNEIPFCAPVHCKIVGPIGLMDLAIDTYTCYEEDEGWTFITENKGQD